MDPLFGLTATKDTKSMDAAKLKNRSQERHLEQKKGCLDTQLRSRYTKLHHTVSDLHQFLVDIDPRSSKTVVCPRGLSERERREYRRIRKANMPSMTLDEFDVRLENRRKETHAQRGIHRPEAKEGEKIVDVESHAFVAPIHKHRQTMKEAYARATSVDLKYSDTKAGKARRHSDDGQSRRRGSMPNDGQSRRRGSMPNDGQSPKRRSSDGYVTINVASNLLRRRRIVDTRMKSMHRTCSESTTLDPQIREVLQRNFKDSISSDSSDEN